MKPLDFFSAHPVFTRDEFAGAIADGRKAVSRTVDSHLGLYLRAGRIGRVKRGVFFTARPGEAVAKSPVDFLLVASRLAPDAVLGYHTALEAHGYAQSVYERLFFLTQHKVKAVTFRGRVFVPVAPPRVLQRKRLSHTSVVEVERRGLPCRVTSLERTAVDALDRPGLTGGLEEAWRSVSAIPLLDLRAVVDYVRLRNRATLAAKVGLFLERHKEHFSVPARVLEELQSLRPRAPHYLDRSARGRLVAAWNLIVPTVLLEGEWEAVR
ncbi:MAG: transcriptional regulator [Candidatus Rokubacteria bacterium]|nr:transcriptional regulator [Candidatus Rokubacteria bacterium]